MSINLVIVSGFFSPLHSGHMDLLEGCRKYCAENFEDYQLLAIVNNDKQVALKGSCPFLDEKTRLRILQSIDLVDDAILSEDTEDTTIVKTIQRLTPSYFLKGGDRTEATMDPREVAVCEEIGCEIVYGIGGGKTAASSELIKNAVEWYLEKEKPKTLKDFIK